MRCSKCGSDNREGRRFCRSCGSKLGTVCPKCGAQNEPDENFCGDCGTELVTRGPKAAASSPRENNFRLRESPPTREIVVEGERKTVTALFADLKGSTELMESLDPEEARAIIDPALKIMVDAVRRYEGYVVQSTGDGIFALFGAPAAYEDHPQRAVYAALQMQQELRTYRRRAALGVAAPELRVGVNTGEVVVRTVETGGRIEYSPIGHTANLASRLQTVAPAGSVVVSDHTLRLVEGYFELHCLGPTRIKGISEPVNLYEITGLGHLRTHFQLSATRGLTKFVGREREIEQIRRALALAQARRGQIVAVVAEAGTGKSRLLHEFKDRLTPECRLLEAYSVSHGKTSSFLPILDLLNGYFGLADSDDQELRRNKIEMQVAAIDPGLNDTVPYLFNLMSIGGGSDLLSQMDSRLKRQRTLEAFKRIVIGASLKQPLVVIFEDLHWIDDETQEALNLLVDGIASARVLLLVNYRPEYRHSWGNRSHYNQLRLDPLEPQDARVMLDALLGENAELKALKQLIIEETAGNPFFMEELVQALFGERVLIREGGVKITRPLSQVRIPTTVQGILASRIDRLPPPMKELLQAVSVLGKDFQLEIVKAVAPPSEDDLNSMLSRLQLSEFIYEQPGFAGSAFSFKHALTQEVAYNSVLIERRRRLHERAGEAIETLFGNRLDDYVAELAYHYSRSNNATKALTYLKSAGELAVRRSANREAAVLFNSALQILERLPETPERDQQELDLLIELGPALMSIKGFAATECEAVYRRASDLCRRIGETPRLYTVLWGQWMSRSVQAKWDEALDLAQKLMSIADSTRNTELLVEAHHASWNTFTLRGDLEKSEFHVKEGLALYDPEHHGRLFSRFGGHDPGVCAYGHGSINQWLLGNSDQSLIRIREALGLAERLKHYHTTVRGRAAASWLFQLRRDAAPTAEHARVAVELASEYGLPFWQAFANVLMGWSLSEMGEESEGIPLMRQALAQYRDTGSEEHYSYFLLLLAESLLKEGQADQSVDVLAEAEAIFKNNGERFHESEVYRTQAESLLRQSPSRHEVAEGKLREAVLVSKQQGAKAWELRATMSLARLLAKQGSRDEAHSMLAEIYNWFTEGFDTADLKEAKALLDELSG